MCVCVLVCVCLDVLECTVNVHGRAWMCMLAVPCVCKRVGRCARASCLCVCVFLQRDRWEMDGERQHFLSHSIQLDRIY